MSKDCVFPQSNSVGDIVSSTGGISKREYFAAMAMQGYIAGIVGCTDGLDGGALHLSEEEAARESVAYSDALLKELEK